MPQNDYTYNLPQTLIPSITVYGQSHPCELLYLKPTLSGEGAVHCVAGGGGADVLDAQERAINTAATNIHNRTHELLQSVKLELLVLLGQDTDLRAQAEANWNDGKRLLITELSAFADRVVQIICPATQVDVVSQRMFSRANKVAQSPLTPDTAVSRMLNRVTRLLGRRRAEAQADIDTVLDERGESAA